MKMEVLPVQSQFQGQFGVMGSSKIKDWTRPLTPPATNRHLKSASPKTGSGVSQTTKTAIINKNNINNNNNNNNNTINAASDAVADTNRANKLATTENLAPNYANQPDLVTSPSNNTITTTVTTTPTTPLTNGSSDPTTTTVVDESAVQSLALRLQNELRRAKSQHLACTEVLLPSDLLNRIASELIVMSEKEPCGIRGSIIYIEFEDEPNNTRRIASLQLDPNTVSTFELYLTLKQDRSGWTSILPQFLKNLARGSTIMISPDFLVAKTKLYRSLSE
ncbi:protein charybde-like [Sitodiplosis mosellana]|uniref:protein charybde-like n=1 Tax=Sitodiplosis mosellana TaxID=263140 RepID=UPI002443F2F2|nr:protein charybde-like [Sitodiplosis mosellana]